MERRPNNVSIDIPIICIRIMAICTFMIMLVFIRSKNKPQLLYILRSVTANVFKFKTKSSVIFAKHPSKRVLVKRSGNGTSYAKTI